MQLFLHNYAKKVIFYLILDEVAENMPLLYAFTSNERRCLWKNQFGLVIHTQVFSPSEGGWDSFFLSPEMVSDDFMREQEMSIQPERENL